MTIIDITLLILLGGFVLAGFWFGVIHMIGSILGVILGAIGAGWFYGTVAEKIVSYVGGNMNLAKIIAFIVLFVVITRLVGLILWILEKMFGFMTIIPFMKTFDRLLGAALGLVEGTLAIGLCVYFSAHFPVTAGFAAMLVDSEIAHAFNKVGSVLAPLLPAAVRVVKSVI